MEKNYINCYYQLQRETLNYGTVQVMENFPFFIFRAQNHEHALATSLNGVHWLRKANDYAPHTMMKITYNVLHVYMFRLYMVHSEATIWPENLAGIILGGMVSIRGD